MSVEVKLAAFTLPVDEIDVADKWRKPQLKHEQIFLPEGADIKIGVRCTLLEPGHLKYQDHCLSVETVLNELIQSLPYFAVIGIIRHKVPILLIQLLELFVKRFS